LNDVEFTAVDRYYYGYDDLAPKAMVRRD